MGERITFHGRGREHFSADDGYTNNWSRFQFMEKLLSECGDFTDFPIEITGATMAAKIDKVLEIFYGAKRAQITSVWDSDVLLGFGVVSASINPRVQSGGGMGAGGTIDFVATGYWTLDESGIAPCYPASFNFLDSPYSCGPLAVGIYFPSEFSFRDANSSERGMWLAQSDTASEQPLWNNILPSPVGVGFWFYSGSGSYYGFDDLSCRTAFSWFSTSTAGSATMPTLAIPYAWQDNGFGIVYETLELSIEFSGLIALVGDIDDLYNPANRLFLGLRFNAYWAFGYMSSGQFFPGANTTSARYVMRLSSGDLSCPLNSDYATLSGDIVHTATEWFPYSTKAGLPAWDAATGLPINGGPSA